MHDTKDSDTNLRVVAQVDTAIRLYRDLGFSSERIAAQLARSGYPLTLIRERFPDLPEILYPAPRTPRPRSAPLRLERSNPLAVKPTAQLLPNVLDDVRRREAAQAALAPSTLESSCVGGIAFQYVPLIQCSFPHADPGELRTFTRRNGWLELTLSTARPDTGLPYGVPARLLTIYCASEAIRTRSPEIFLGRSVHEFLRRLDVPITRGERGSLRIYANQLLRLIHCAVSIDENIRDASGRTGLHIRQALFAEEARLWWDEGAGVGQGSSFVLSPVLFQSILERSAPLSTVAIRQLRKSPMDLDVYAWLVHRLFHLSRSSALSWEQLSGQFGHSYGEIRYFRRFFGDSLQRVLKVYPEAKVKPTETGLLLMPSRPHVVQRSNPERT
jgi:Plasmid encoded RepA protein